MRILKFRAWDEKHKQWLKGFDYPYRHSGLWLNTENGKLTHITEGGDNDIVYTPHKNIILSQFTGLTDKNGVDIYEGDIGYWMDNNPYDGEFEIKAPMVWQQNNAQFRFDTSNFPPQYKKVREEDIEIIGNIYEHPNLLTP